MHEKSAKDLWKKLEAKYMTKSIENRLYLKKKLFRFEYKGGISLSEHLDNFDKILADLQNLDVKIDDEDKALLLLNSLPDSYEHLINTLLYGKEEIKYGEVSSILTNNEVRKKDKDVYRDPTSEVLVVRGRSENWKPASSERSQSKLRSDASVSERKIPEMDECAFCHNKGHWKKDCPRLKNKVTKHPTANVVNHEDGDDGDSEFAKLL